MDGEQPRPASRHGSSDGIGACRLRGGRVVYCGAAGRPGGRGDAAVRGGGAALRVHVAVGRGGSSVAATVSGSGDTAGRRVGVRGDSQRGHAAVCAGWQRAERRRERVAGGGGGGGWGIVDSGSQCGARGAQWWAECVEEFAAAMAGDRSAVGRRGGGADPIRQCWWPPGEGKRRGERGCSSARAVGIRLRRAIHVESGVDTGRASTIAAMDMEQVFYASASRAGRLGHATGQRCAAGGVCAAIQRPEAAAILGSAVRSSARCD
eukprot:ctg_2434.g498